METSGAGKLEFIWNRRWRQAYDHIAELQQEHATMKKASAERCARDQGDSQATQTDAASELPWDQRESQAAVEASGISAPTRVAANVVDDRTTQDANILSEGHSALQVENQKLFEYAESLQQHVDQLLAALRENVEPMKALQHRVDEMIANDAKNQAEPQTRADVISKLEESNAALQQKTSGGGRQASARHVHRKSRAGAGRTDGRREKDPSCRVIGHTGSTPSEDARTTPFGTKAYTSVQYES